MKPRKIDANIFGSGDLRKLSDYRLKRELTDSPTAHLCFTEIIPNVTVTIYDDFQIFTIFQPKLQDLSRDKQPLGFFISDADRSAFCRIVFVHVVQGWVVNGYRDEDCTSEEWSTRKDARRS
jgi:hypothetical protein